MPRRITWKNQPTFDWGVGAEEGAGSQEPGDRREESSTVSTPARPLYTDDPVVPLPGETVAVAVVVPRKGRTSEAEPLQVERSRHRRTDSRMPVPRPLAEAVAAGHFGHDESGQIVRPTAEEVREITETHACNLMDLLAEHRQASAEGTEEDRQHLLAEFDAGIDKYAESFGTTAAQRLRAHVHRLAGVPLSHARGR